VTIAINWLKNNVFIVVCLLIMIAALAAFPLIAGRMNAAIQVDVKARAAKNTKLDSLPRTNLVLGAEPKQALPNRKLLDLYREYWTKQSQDAQQVRELALGINQQGRGVLEPELFPRPKPEEHQVLPKRFHDKLMAAYDALVKKINAGTPPAIEELTVQLERAASNFRINDLRKGEAEPLTAEEDQRLKQELSMVRLAQYVQAAEKISLYCSTDVLSVPAWPQGPIPPLAELFQWQWQFWINQDLLEALASANAGSPSVAQGPVKRIVWISAPADAGGGRSGSTGGMGGGSEGGAEGGSEGAAIGARRPRSGRGFGGDGGDGSAPADGQDQPLGKVAVNWSTAIAEDYSISFTGRKSNEIYDVKFVELRIVVESESIPAVLDALARRNFITVLDLTMTPVDNFAAAREGYYYGDVPCSELRLVLETVWLREWTGDFMPADLRDALGIRSVPPAAGGTENF